MKEAQDTEVAGKGFRVQGAGLRAYKCGFEISLLLRFLGRYSIQGFRIQGLAIEVPRSKPDDHMCICRTLVLARSVIEGLP